MPLQHFESDGVMRLCDVPDRFKHVPDCFLCVIHDLYVHVTFHRQ